MPTPLFDGALDSVPGFPTTSSSGANVSPFRGLYFPRDYIPSGYTASDCSGVRRTVLPEHPHPWLELWTYDNGFYGINTADTPDTATVRSNCSTPNSPGGIFDAGKTSVLVSRLMHSYPTATMPAPSHNVIGGPIAGNAPGSAFAGTGAGGIYGPPTAGSAPNSLRLRNNSAGTAMEIYQNFKTASGTTIGTFTMTLPPAMTPYTIIRRNKMSSGRNANDAEVEIWVATGNNPAVKQNISLAAGGTTQKITGWCNLNDSNYVGPQYLDVQNYHRYGMWDGKHISLFIWGPRIYDAADVTSITAVDPYTIYNLGGAGAATPPPVPAGLAAVVGDGRFTLSWTASAGATSYNVRAGATGSTVLISPTGISQLITNVVNGSTATWRVSAVGPGGESSSALISFPMNGVPVTDLAEPFDGVTVDQGRWPIITGSPVVGNGVLTLQPTVGAPIQSVGSEAKYLTAGRSLIVGPILWTGAQPTNTGKVERGRVLLTQDRAAGDYIAVLRETVVASDSVTSDYLFVKFVNNFAEDPGLPAAAGITFNESTMAYVKFDVASNGTGITVSTSPDGTTWTSRRAATATYSFLDRLASVDVVARIPPTGGGTPVVPPTSVAAVNIVGGSTAPSSGVAKLPAGLANGDLIVTHVAAGNLAATISNAADLPFVDLLDPDQSLAGVVGVSVRTWVMVKRFDPLADIGDWTINFSAATEWAIKTFRVSGADSSAADYGLSVPAVQTLVPSGSFVTTAIASPVANCRLHVLVAADTDLVSGNWGAAPGSMTKLYEAKEATGGVDIAAYAETVAAAATSATRTISHGASGGVAATIVSFYVRPGQTTSVTDPSVTQSVLDAALRANASTQSGNYTFALTDDVVEFTGASAQVATVPPNSSVAFPIGKLIEVCQYGAGSVTLAAGAGVTIRSPGGLLAVSGQYRSVALRKRGTNEWMLEGSLA